MRAEFAFAQARMQARHGGRLPEGDWKMLDGAQSASLYLDRARASSLKRFLGKVTPALSSVGIERALREEARAYAREIAAWTPSRWRPAIEWLGVLPLLPLVRHAEAGVEPLVKEAGTQTFAALVERARAAEPAGIAAAWVEDWRAFWPRDSKAASDRDQLVATAGRLLGPLAASGKQGGAAGGRPGLEPLLVRAFRQHAATPVAAIAHVGLALLDLERLRGGLVRRVLFGQEDERQAA